MYFIEFKKEVKRHNYNLLAKEFELTKKLNSLGKTLNKWDFIQPYEFISTEEINCFTMELVGVNLLSLLKEKKRFDKKLCFTICRQTVCFN